LTDKTRIESRIMKKSREREGERERERETRDNLMHRDGFICATAGNR